VIPLTSDVP